MKEGRHNFIPELLVSTCTCILHMLQEHKNAMDGSPDITHTLIIHFAGEEGERDREDTS